MDLELVGVSKRYDKKILDNINIKFGKGVYGLLGPNGAGKSTLIRLICNIEATTTGKITYGGVDIGKLDEKYRDILGYVPQKTGFYDDFTAQEFLDYMAIMKGLSKKKSSEQVSKALEVMNLWDERNKRLKTFSGGMKQRVNIGQALLNDPQILILDEPTVGLDLKERMSFKQYISELSIDKTVIFATHISSDIEDIGSEIILMKEGKILHQNTLHELMGIVKNKVWEIKCSKTELIELKKKGKVSNTRMNGDELILRLVTEKRPCDSAVNVVGNLQDLYLFLFETTK